MNWRDLLVSLNLYILSNLYRHLFKLSLTVSVDRGWTQWKSVKTVSGASRIRFLSTMYRFDYCLISRNVKFWGKVFWITTHIWRDEEVCAHMTQGHQKSGSGVYMPWFLSGYLKQFILKTSGILSPISFSGFLVFSAQHVCSTQLNLCSWKFSFSDCKPNISCSHLITLKATGEPVGGYYCEASRINNICWLSHITCQQNKTETFIVLFSQ